LRACTKSSLGILIVDADAAFHRHRDVDDGPHRRDAVADERRLAHQARPETAVLHAVGRAADIEVDLVVTEIGTDAGGLRELARHGAAELHADGMLCGIETEQGLAPSVDHRAGGHHLGVEAGATREDAVEEPAMPVRPVHHRRDREADVQRGHRREIATGRTRRNALTAPQWSCLCP
jgi:hypothetical protein